MREKSGGKKKEMRSKMRKEGERPNRWEFEADE
jgi:hypothetical protein